MHNFDFITDKVLRKTIEDAIEYIQILFEESKKKSQNNLYQEETYRVIILYTVSIVEAVLLYVYKVRGGEIALLEYKHVNTLPKSYKYQGEEKSPVVIAIQKSIKRYDHQIGLFDLANFFESKKLMVKDTSSSILKLNNIRNTFHFSKSREAIKCDSAQVESAFKLLLHIIQKAPKVLAKK